MGGFDVYIDSLFADSGSILAASIKSWKNGIDYEVNFWTKWFESKGLQWPDDYETRLVAKPLVPWLADLLPRASMDRIDVLDVGAGPITVTGSFLPDRDMRLVAVDPLARHYAKIIGTFGVEPPHRTEFSFAEDISARFDLGSFDLVSCTNALDHAIEPVWGILEMLIVTKLGGNIALYHRRNEAEFEGYSGFHQWNFDEDGFDFVIWNKDRRINVSDVLDGVGVVTCRMSGEQLSVIIHKISELPVENLLYQRRLRAGLLEAFLV